MVADERPSHGIAGSDVNSGSPTQRPSRSPPASASGKCRAPPSFARGERRRPPPSARDPGAGPPPSARRGGRGPGRGMLLGVDQLLPGCSRPRLRQPGEMPSGCSRQRALAVMPEPGVLRPMARALLSVAAEVHAARCDPLGAGRRPATGGLRMGNRGLVQGVNSGGPFSSPFSRHSGADRVWVRVVAGQGRCTPASGEPRLYG